MKSQIPGTYSRLGLAAVRVIEERDRNVLIRSPNAVGKEVRRGKERRHRRKRRKVWELLTLAAFYLCGI